MSGSTSVMQAMPDLLFMLGRDGVVREFLGGGKTCSLFDPLKVVAATPESAWPDPEIGRAVRRATRRVLSTRSSHCCKFDMLGTQCEFRFNPQGRNSVLLIVRQLVDQAGQSSDDCDSLTSLPKLTTFRERIDQAIANATLREQGFAVLHIDFDRFGSVNEAFGQAVGDAVLKQAAERLRSCLRGADEVLEVAGAGALQDIARADGDDFLLLLDDVTTRESVSAAVERIRLALTLPFRCDAREVELTQCIGIAFFPRDGTDAVTLLANANAALREAKIGRCNSEEFYSDTLRLRRMDKESELRSGLEQNQFELHYMPKIELCTDRVVGVEALLRWQHPFRGSVPLAEVLPVAEATGLIVELGELVLRRACEQARRWSADGVAALPVSINLSRREFARDDLLGCMTTILEQTGVAAAQIQLEITEDVVLRTRHAADVLGRLQARGVGIVLDDFGTGLFSIPRLKSLPIDALKIDDSIVARLDGDSDARAVCAAILAMARELDLRVIAEGVETDGQLAFLRDKGCDLAQGYLFTRPLPPAAIPEFLSARTRAAARAGRSA